MADMRAARDHHRKTPQVGVGSSRVRARARVRHHDDTRRLFGVQSKNSRMREIPDASGDLAFSDAQ
jgi:hypothetical protein